MKSGLSVLVLNTNYFLSKDIKYTNRRVLLLIVIIKCVFSSLVPRPLPPFNVTRRKVGVAWGRGYVFSTVEVSPTPECPFDANHLT